jgi:two-component system response regulator AtoC
MTKALVVDDERKMRRILQMVLERMGIDGVAADSAEQALELFERERFALVLTDLRMPGLSGIDLLARVRARDPDVPVIVLTAFGTVETAVEAMKRGAFDYVLKPFDLDAIELTIRRALETRQYRTASRPGPGQPDGALGLENMIGVSPAMQAVYVLVRRAAPTRSTVLVTGETGTGKELVARAIHALSPRRDKLFVPLNCAAIPAELLESELFGHTRGAFTGADRDRTGKFELADGGTLFLDEIGDMAYPLQAKLLRVLQESVIERIGSNKRVTVDVRVISSTHRDLAAAMRDEKFREDLYYRLNVVHIDLPPLRARREDVAPLAAHFLAAAGRELGRGPLTATPEVLQVLEQHDWPGNVRELQNLMERAAVLSDEVALDAHFLRLLLPAAAGVPGAGTAEEPLLLEPAVEAVERKLILRALGAANDNKARAARLLGVSERTLWYKLKRYGL